MNGEKRETPMEMQGVANHEDIANVSASLKGEAQPQEKKENKRLLAVMIAGFFCPLIWVVYFLSKNWSSVKAVSKPILKDVYNGLINSTARAGGTSSTPALEEGSSEKKFLITGGDGNIYESGGMFCDWAGNRLTWGSAFRDARGNLVEWGSPFYDNRDNYVAWGSPFYDAGNNYINPRG